MSRKPAKKFAMVDEVVKLNRVSLVIYRKVWKGNDWLGCELDEENSWQGKIYMHLDMDL